MSTEANPQSPKRSRRGMRRVVLWCIVVMAVLAGAASGGAYWLKGRDIAAPQIMRDQIETRLRDVLPEARVSFGEMVMVLGEDWLPRALVRDVVIKTPESREIISFSELRASAALRPLLHGQIELETLDASGIFLTLQRSRDGALTISGGTGQSPVNRAAPNLAQLITDMDEFLLRPGFDNLSRATVRAVTLRYEDARTGRAWTIDGGRMRLVRENTDLQISVDLAILGGGAQVATVAANYSGQIGAQASDFGVTFTDVAAVDIADQGAAFAWLSALQAPISGALRGGVTEQGTFNPLNATFQIGAGFIQPTPQSAAIPIDGARSYFTYFPQTRALRFDDLSVDSQWGRGQLEGQAVIGLASEGRIGDLVGQFRLSNIAVNPDEFYPAPVSIDAAELDFKLSVNPFVLQIGRLQIEDLGQVLTASGTLGADKRGWDIALDGTLDGLDPARLKQLWPKAVKPKSRKWVDENIIGGHLHDIHGALRLTGGQKIPDLYVDFGFRDGETRFLKTMPPLKGAQGHATLLRDRFVVVADAGYVDAPQGGRVDVAGTSFIIPDVKIKDFTPGVVRLRANGPIQAALSLLDQPPLAIMTKAGRTPDIATGQATVQGTISVPMEKNVPVELVEFHLTGTLQDVVSDVLVPGRVLGAQRLELVASSDQVALSGRGDLDGVPFDVVWRQPLGAGQDAGSSVTGTVALNTETLDAFKVNLPPGTLSGEARGILSIALNKDGPPKLKLSSDLNGARLTVPPIGWTKPAATRGQFDLAMTLSKTPVIDAITLNAAGLQATGDIVLTSNGDLDRVRLSRLQVGNWLDAPVVLRGRGAGVTPAIELTGGRLDLRRAEFAENSGTNSATTPLSIALDTLQVSDSIAVRNLRGQFTSGGVGLSGTFQGSVNGAAPVRGQVIPQQGRSAIRITAQDAGQVVAAAGVLKQGRGGQLELTLTPVGTGGAFDGKLKVQDISVVDAPTIAALLNGISIVGLVNELGGDGIYFSEVDADFRLSPSRITLREASAVGSSMGLSMDGVFIPDTGQIQMQGVITPVYLLNGIGSIFTRKGEGLFGFNYSIRGTTADPDVSVNPLSALAPSGLRNLFRAPKPDVPLAEGETPPPPEPARKPRVAVSGSDR